jgi:hypothetical protein
VNSSEILNCCKQAITPIDLVRRGFECNGDFATVIGVDVSHDAARLNLKGGHK